MPQLCPWSCRSCSMKLLVKACGYSGQHPGVKLWNFMSVKLGLARKDLGWINKGLKIACDNHTAQMVQFIVSILWSHWRSMCHHNEHLPVAASWSVHTALQLYCFGQQSLEEVEICAEAELMETGSNDIWTLSRFNGHWFAGQASWGESSIKLSTTTGWVKYEYITEAEYIVKSIIPHLLAINALQKIFFYFIHWPMEISIYGIDNDIFQNEMNVWKCSEKEQRGFATDFAFIGHEYL